MGTELIADILGTIIHLIISGVIGGIFVWLAGKALGAPKATYWHGISIVILAIILTDLISYFLGPTGWIGIIVELVVILLLIRHFFGVGWLKAIVIAILAIVILAIVVIVLAYLGIAVAVATVKGIMPSMWGVVELFLF
jgi:hypothetical protein